MLDNVRWPAQYSAPANREGWAGCDSSSCGAAPQSGSGCCSACSRPSLAGFGAPGRSAQVGSDRYASIVIDAQTGNVLTAANPDEYRYPASLTKLMTIYLLFEALRDGRLAHERSGAGVRLGRRRCRRPSSGWCPA